MAVLHLHGALADFYPEPLHLHVASPAEAVRALLANFPGIGEAIRAGSWHVIRGDRDAGLCLDHDELTIGLGPDTELHLIPAVEGSRGAGKAIIGAVILVVAVVAAVYTGGSSMAFAEAMAQSGWSAGMMSYTGLAMFGASMMASGISQMLAQTPKMQSLESADKAKSYIFAGPTNRLEQGNVVPVIYGRCRVGSVVVAASITNDDIAASSDGGYVSIAPDSAYTVANADPIDFTANSSVSATSGFKITDVTGGTLKTVTAGIEADVPEGGVVLGNQALTLRFRAVWTPPEYAELQPAGGDAVPAVWGWRNTYAGGGFKVQAVVGLIPTPTGAPTAVTIVPVSINSVTGTPGGGNGPGGSGHGDGTSSDGFGGQNGDAGIGGDSGSGFG